MTRRPFSLSRTLIGAVLGAVFGMIVLLLSANITVELLGGDEPAGTVGEILLLFGIPVVLVLGAVLGGYAFGRRSRAVFVAIAGALVGMIAIFIVAVPISIIYAGALDRTGVLFLLFYGMPVAIGLGAVIGKRRFGRGAADDTPE